jgi:hypothetical protein
MPVQASQSTKRHTPPGKSYRAALIPVAILMLIFWGLMTFRFGAPGWANIFLSLGVFLLIWGITERGSTGRRS